MSVLAIAVILLGAQEQAAQWSFDDLALPAGSRLSLVDSPIGAKGQALVLNGVDAAFEAGGPKKLGDDFTVAFWVCPLDARDSVLLSRTGAWTLRTLRDGSLKFETAKVGGFQSPARTLAPHRWVHLLLEVQKGKPSHLAVNGQLAAQGQAGEGIDPEGAALVLGNASGEKSFFCGLVDDLRVYSSILPEAKIREFIDEGLPWVRSVKRDPFEGRFALEPKDVVVFVGAEDTVAAQENGALEGQLAMKGVVFRSMACEGDTVYEQPRLLNFGSWRDQLSKVGAGVIVARFGATEALEGPAGLAKFEAAYDRLLQEFSESTKRIVVVSPVPYEKPAGLLPDLSKRNEDLKRYVEVMKALAEKRRLIFVDLFNARWSAPVTRDGLHVSETGQAAVAMEIARQLGVKAKAPAEDLLAAIRKKNRVWMDYWRPSNWAFLNGDRIEQPSSRDHVDRRVRWFPVEVQQTFAVLRHEEAAVDKLLDGGR